MAKKQLNIVEVLKTIQNEGFPIAYFVFKKRITDLLSAYYSFYGRSVPELSVGNLSNEFGISSSFVSQNFKIKSEIYIFLILHLLAICNEENFVRYHNFFIQNFSGITVTYNLNPHYKKIPLLEFPLEKKKLLEWLRKYKETFEDYSLSRKTLISSSYSHKYTYKKGTPLLLERLLSEDVLNILEKDMGIVSKRIKKYNKELIYF